MKPTDHVERKLPNSLPEISSIFGKIFPFPFPYFALIKHTVI